MKYRSYLLNAWRRLLALGVITLLLSTMNVDAQYWEATLGGIGSNDNSMGNAIIEMDDGNFMVVGASDFGHPDSIYVAKISWDGSLLWDKNYASGAAYNVKMTAPDRYTIVGSRNLTQQAFVGTIDGNGNVLDYHFVGNDVKGHDFTFLMDSSIVICGTNSFSSKSIVLKVSKSGQLDWQYTYDQFNARLTSILEKNNVIYCSGVANDSLVFMKLDTSGSLLWRKSYFKDHSWGSELHIDHDGSFLISGSDASSPYYSTARILKLDSVGHVITSFDFGNTVGIHYEPFGFSLTDDMGYVISGSKRYNCCNRYRFLRKLDASGIVEWEKMYFDAFPMPMNNGCRTIQTSDGGYAAIGRQFGGAGANYQLSATKVNNRGHFPTNSFSGSVYIDSDSNCQYNVGDVLVPNALIMLNEGESFSFTDTAGRYTLMLDSGQHTIELVDQNNYLSGACPVTGIYNVSFNGFHQESDNNDFSMTSVVNCPLLSIDFGTPVLNPCNQAAYYFEYSNIGTETAFDAYVEVELDTFLTISNLSTSYTEYNNVITIDLNNLSPMQQGQFIMIVDVDCNAPVNSTAYVTSKIFSDTLCNVNPNWDQSEISIRSECIGDSINFIIRNQGGPGIGDMDTSLHYRVYEDNIVHLIDPYQLNGGDSLEIKLPVNGQTYTLQADQHPHHPYQSFAQKHVEQCDGNLYTTGIMQQFAQPDEHPSVEIDLQVIEAILPTGLKSVQPQGFLTNHIVSDEDELEYTIYFQKENSYLTFEIADSLSPYVDLLSFQQGASSHRYEFELTGHHVARWKMSDYYSVGGILLPGSDQGFVKFKIAQLDSNITGTLIESRASLNSNFTAPVATNKAFNTVYKSDCDEFSNLGIAQTTDSLYAQLPADSMAMLCNLKQSAECLSVVTVDAPNNGSLIALGPECIIYQPNEEYTGSDTFAVCLCADIWCDTIRAFCDVNSVSNTIWQTITGEIEYNFEVKGDEGIVAIVKYPKTDLPADEKGQQTDNFLLYPNIVSAGAIIQVNLSSSYIDSFVHFTLYDIYGKQLQSESNLSQGFLYLDTRNLERGTYFYELVLNNSQSISGKLMVR